MMSSTPSSSATKAIISLREVSVVYNAGKTSEFTALSKISLDIYPEEFVIFFGPSGSGKSTLLYLIAGLEQPSSGTISVAEYPNITTLSDNDLIQYHRSSVGMVFQAFYLIPSLSARNNVLLPRVFAGDDPEIRAKRADELLERFGIVDFQHRMPTQMSGGQQQRVAIARSLVNDPHIVLADEPVGNLDSKNADIVLEMIAQLPKTDKKTVILVTHDPRHLKMADRVFYIKDGLLVRVADQRAEHGYDALAQSDTEQETVETKTESILTQLAKIYPHFDEHQLKAKFVVNHLLEPYDLMTLAALEQVIGEFLLGAIDATRLQKKLDDPVGEGGIGLNSKTAHKLTKQLTHLIQEMDLVEKRSDLKEEHEEVKTAREIMRYVLDEYPGTLPLSQVQRCIVGVRFRISGKYSPAELRDYFDRPQSEGGVGLHTALARNFSETVEVVLLQRKTET